MKLNEINNLTLTEGEDVDDVVVAHADRGSYVKQGNRVFAGWVKGKPNWVNLNDIMHSEDWDSVLMSDEQARKTAQKLVKMGAEGPERAEKIKKNLGEAKSENFDFDDCIQKEYDKGTSSSRAYRKCRKKWDKAKVNEAKMDPISDKGRKKVKYTDYKQWEQAAKSVKSGEVKKKFDSNKYEAVQGSSERTMGGRTMGQWDPDKGEGYLMKHFVSDE